MRSSDTFSHTFNTPGTDPYCAVHSFPGGTMMNGVVEVSGAGAPIRGGGALSAPQPPEIIVQPGAVPSLQGPHHVNQTTAPSLP